MGIVDLGWNPECVFVACAITSTSAPISFYVTYSSKVISY